MTLKNRHAKVQSGKGRGKAIGFPTLNLAIPEDLDCPNGIYAGWVWLGDNQHAAAIHFGPIPVFHEKTPVLEAHLIEAELEGRPAQATFQLVSFLREIRNFESIDDLVNQIESDIQETKKALGL